MLYFFIIRFRPEEWALPMLTPWLASSDVRCFDDGALCGIFAPEGGLGLGMFGG